MTQTVYCYLRVYYGNNSEDYALPTHTEKIFLIGRAEDANLNLGGSQYSYVSNRHCYIVFRHGAYYLKDGSPDGIPSSNGTYLNHKRLNSSALKLQIDDVIGLGEPDKSVRIVFRYEVEAPRKAEKQLPVRQATDENIRRIQFTNHDILIGRSKHRANLVIDHPSISNLHAIITHEGSQPIIIDQQSTNGTFVNGRPVSRAALKPGDEIRVGSTPLRFEMNNQLTQMNSKGMRLDVLNLSKTYSQNDRPTLQNISFNVSSSEFLVLGGGSGAGKSTLMKVLNGTLQPDAGSSVLLNGYDFHEYYDFYRMSIGYVPQHEILHKSLPLERALYYTARLRLAEDASPQEIRERIDSVLQIVELSDSQLRKRRIQALSGGQQKRVSIAAELLSDPQLFFLDEPTAGLDPPLKEKMMQMMRHMADQGRTIILITHEMEDVGLADNIGFIGFGRLVFFGRPKDALHFFEVTEYSKAYSRFETPELADKWMQRFQQSAPAQRLQQSQKRPQNIMPSEQLPLGGKPFHVNPKFQFKILFQRSFEVILRDRVTTLILFLIMPLIGLIIGVVYDADGIVGKSVIASNESYSGWGTSQSALFLMALATIFLGICGSFNELIKEREIFQRETMINLRILPYLLSKMAVFAVFAAVQCALLLLILQFRMEMPQAGVLIGSVPEFYITLFLATLASISIGLVISAIGNSNMGAYLLMIGIFLQIVFSNAIFKLEGAMELFTYLSVSRWALTGLGTSSGIVDLAQRSQVCASGFCETPSDVVSQMNLPYGEDFGMLALVWLVLIGFVILFNALSYFLLKRSVGRHA